MMIFKKKPADLSNELKRSVDSPSSFRQRIDIRSAIELWLNFVGSGQLAKGLYTQVAVPRSTP